MTGTDCKGPLPATSLRIRRLEPSQISVWLTRGWQDMRHIGWPSYLASLTVDTENQDEVTGGRLLVWAPEFCKDVQQAAKTGFYKGIAQITAEHLSMELNPVDELLATVA